jgi:glycosyltransferase involved in cell wall biosynthesis
MRVGLVIPHIFLHKDILPNVIFSPGTLALDLAAGLQQQGADVTLFSPGPIDTPVRNISADLSYFEQELAGRGDTYIELLKKHPLIFISLARQVQAEIISKAFAMANNDELDVIHIYTNEEDVALPFVQFCKKPVLLTHHDPYNFLVKYRTIFPKYKRLNWISVSLSQRQDMPMGTNWVSNIYHGVEQNRFLPNYQPKGNYMAYMGRIIESKGVHLAIAAIQQYNSEHPDTPYTLKIAGKHYAGHGKDNYWDKKIKPQIGGHIEYVGFLRGDDAKQEFLGNAVGLLVPSIFREPFGMVIPESLACGTPVIGLESGSIPEIIKDGKIGFVVPRSTDDKQAIKALTKAIAKISKISRQDCRSAFEQRFTLDKMCEQHLNLYNSLSK